MLTHTKRLHEARLERHDRGTLGEHVVLGGDFLIVNQHLLEVLNRRVRAEAQVFGGVDCDRLACALDNRGCQDRDVLGCALLAASRALLVPLALGLGGRRLVDNPLKGVLGLVENLTATADMPVVLGVVRPAGAVGLVLEHTLDRHVHIALDVLELIGAVVSELNGLTVDVDSIVLARKVRAVDADGELCGAVPVELGCRRGERVAHLITRQRHDELAARLHGNLGNGRGVVVGLSLVAHLVHAGSEVLELGHVLAHGLVLGGALSAPLHGAVGARDLAVLLAAHGLGLGLDHRRVLRGVLDGEFAGQAIGGQRVVARGLARQLGEGRRIGADLGLGTVNECTKVILADDVAKLCHGAVLLAVVDEFGGTPRHGEQTLVNDERAVDERNRVVGVRTLGLRQAQSITALAHVVTVLALDLELKRIVPDELARGDRPLKDGVFLAIDLGGVLSADRDRTRFDLERHLAFDRRTADHHLIGNIQHAGVLDLGGSGRPGLAVVGAVLGRRTLGQRRSIDRVIRAVVFAGVAGNGGSRNLLGGKGVPADDALMVTEALLGRRGRRVDNPRKGVCGLVNLAAASALVPVRIVVGDPRIAHSLVLAHALDRHPHVALDVLDDELAAVVERRGVSVDLDGIGEGVGKVAVLDADSEGGRAMPVELGRVSRELVADLFGGQRHSELAARGNRNLGRGGDFVVVIGAVPHLVRAHGKAAELGRVFGHSLILARVLGAPLHGGVDARDPAVSLGADGLGHTLDHRRALGRLLDGELARQTRGRQLVVALVGARQLGDLRRVGAGLDRAAVDIRGDVVIADDVAELRLGAMLLAVVGELGGGVPLHGELALVDGELAINERNLVVGVGDVGLRRRHDVAALVHGLAGLAGDGDALKGLALDELALGDLPAQFGIIVTVRLGGIGRRHSDLARRHHKLRLALDSGAVDGRAVLERQGADVLDLGDRGRPSNATVDAVRDRRALGQGRDIGSVDLAVILAGIAGNRGCRDYNLIGGVVVTDSAMQMFGSRLLDRRLLVDYPLEGMLCNVNPLTARANMPVRRTVALPAGAIGLVLGDTLNGDRGVFLNLRQFVNTLLAGFDGLAVCLNSKTLGRVIAIRNRKLKRRRTMPVELGRVSRERVARLLSRQRQLKLRPSDDGNGNDLGGFIIRRRPVAQAI